MKLEHTWTLIKLKDIRLATYKCVVVFGSFFAISSRLLPTDVHFTVSPKSSNWQLQFPANEHKNGGPKPLPPSWLLPLSPLRPSPLPGPGGGLCCDVSEMAKLHTRIWTPLNIIDVISRANGRLSGYRHSAFAFRALSRSAKQTKDRWFSTNFRIFNTL